MLGTQEARVGVPLCRVRFRPGRGLILRIVTECAAEMILLENDIYDRKYPGDGFGIQA